MSFDAHPYGPSHNVGTGWVGAALLWAGFGLALAFLVGFGWHCASVVNDVAHLRGDLEDRVVVVVRLSKLRGLLNHADGAGDRTAQCEGLSERLGEHGIPSSARRSVRRVLDAACGPAELGPERVQGLQAHIDEALSVLRGANARTSAELGAYWKQLNVLAVTSVMFGATTLLLAFVMAHSALRGHRSASGPAPAGTPSHPPPGERPPPSGPGDRIPARAGRLQILIVDDELPVARSLARILRNHDCDIAEGGAEALKRLDGRDYDLIFCDVTMPDVSGVDVYEALKKEGTGRERKLVFLTGGVFTDRARNLVKSLPERVLDKPFDVATIRGLVARWRHT